MGVNGAGVHSVIVSGRYWYDAAHENAKRGHGVDMAVEGWQASMPYEWDLWVCSDVRQLYMPGTHGYTCQCGTRVNRLSHVTAHNEGKRHRKWARWEQRNTKPPVHTGPTCAAAGE